MKKYICFIILLFGIHFSKAQIRPEKFMESSYINPLDSNVLSLKIENANFLKNNEFFNDYHEGYTLLGYVFRPSLVYKPTSKTRIEAGVHLLKYSGLDDYTQTLPFFRFQYHFNKYMDIVLGSIYGSDNHQLIEPIFSQEHFYKDNIENGIQFLTKLRWFQGDLWMNWEKFIFPNSPYKEEFVIGTSNKISLLDSSYKLQVSIPFQGIVAHKGGQIDQSETDMVSISNSAAGVEFDLKFKNSYLELLNFKAITVWYEDMSHTINTPFSRGTSYYVSSTLFTRNIDLMLGYWYGEKFIAPRGEPLYQCISEFKPDFVVNSHELFLCKLNIFTQKIKNVYLSGGFEYYFDPSAKTGDYWYGCHIIYRDLFKIKDFKKK